MANSVHWIRAERKKRGLSQANLARITDLSQAKISQWELGKAEPSDSAETRIRKAFEKLDQGRYPPTMRLRNHRLARKKCKTLLDDEVSASASSVPKVTWAHITEQARQRKRPPNARPIGVALFAGCGGMALGFQQAGFDVAGHVEMDVAARSTFAKNLSNSVLLGTDIRSIETDEARRWKELFGPIPVVFGGPPCQGFSLAGKRDKHDSRNQLFRDFARIVTAVNPACFVMENVRLLTSMKTPDGGLITDLILATFEELGYSVAWASLNAQDYGVPQFRERVFFMGICPSQVGEISPTFPPRTHGPNTDANLFEPALEPYVTFRQATGDLEPLEVGERSQDDPLHWASRHPDHVVAWLKDVPEGCSAHDNPDPALRPPSGYNTTYKRLRWDEPCSTVGTTFGMISACRNVHPRDTRAITIREAARCQTFPDRFPFCGTTTQVRTQIGNAVPPLLAKAIASHVRRSFLTKRKTAQMTTAC